MISLFRTESYQKGIVLSTSFNFLSKGILLFNNILIAYYFGTQERTDLYFFIFPLVNFVAYFISALNSTVIIPESMKIREECGENASMAFLNKFFFIFFFIGLLLTLIFSFKPIFVYGLFSKFSNEILIRNYSILLLGSSLFLLMILTNFLTEILASYKFFSIPMFAQFLNSFFVFFFLIFFHNSMEINSIFIGLIIAFSINLFILFYLLKYKLSWNFLNYRYKVRKKVWIDTIYSQSGNFASLLSNFAPTYIFSGFSSGILSALNYGQKTASMPNDIISGQFTSIAGIRFNELFAQKDFNKINIVFQETVKSLIFILIPISGFVFLFSSEIIDILYLRGKFEIEIANVSAFYLKFLILAIPFNAFLGVIGRLFISGQKISLTFYNQIIVNLLLITSIYFFVRIYGYKGFPYAILLITLLNVIINIFLIKHIFRFIFLKKIFIFSIIIFLEVFFILFICNYINSFLEGIILFFRILINFCFFLGLFIFFNYLFKVNLTFLSAIKQIIKKDK